MTLQGEEEGEYDEDADPDYNPQVGIGNIIKTCTISKYTLSKQHFKLKSCIR